MGKRHCEKWLLENCAVPFTVVRIPAVMGWDDPTNRMWWWVQRALDGQAVAWPLENQGPFRTLYSDDAASNFIRAMDAPRAANPRPLGDSALECGGGGASDHVRAKRCSDTLDRGVYATPESGLSIYPRPVEGSG